ARMPSPAAHNPLGPATRGPCTPFPSVPGRPSRPDPAFMGIREPEPSHSSEASLPMMAHWQDRTLSLWFRQHFPKNTLRLNREFALSVYGRNLDDDLV